jgi:hypothetical protein
MTPGNKRKKLIFRPKIFASRRIIPNIKRIIPQTALPVTLILFHSFLFDYYKYDNVLYYKFFTTHSINIAPAKRVAFRTSKRGLTFSWLFLLLLFNNILTEYFYALSLFGIQVKNDHIAYLDISIVKPFI